MNLDVLEEVLAWCVGGLLALSALFTLVRMTRGPSVLDRVVASDVIVSIVVCALGAHAALTSGSTTLPLLISLSLVGFMGSVAVARFVARDRDPAPGDMPERGTLGGQRANWPQLSPQQSGQRPAPSQLGRGEGPAGGGEGAGESGSEGGGERAGGRDGGGVGEGRGERAGGRDESAAGRGGGA